ncbi:serine/threonine-protein kinase [Kitasatospora sp. NPDC006697]|uniref:serine/threonine-protein kinase n=1 Tax=Kitasatospora sp. NPDC006697 TaxID=3364020 RepID=UPI0036BD16F8
MRANDVLDGRYRLVGKLGQGGFGVVWEAYDTRLQRQVAIKALRSPTGPHAVSDLARLLREILVLAKLVHPNIVQVYDQGEAESDGEWFTYLVMELLNGQTLKTVLEGGRPELLTALRWSVQLCEALAAAHAADVIHRDIKPENIMFTSPDRRVLKVLDFGIAQIADNQDGLTGTHDGLLGSAPYMAPERWDYQPGTVRTDLYAVGCVLYELLTGTRPFTTDGTFSLMLEHKEAEPARPLAVPTELADLVLQLLAKDPVERPADATEVAERLAQAIEDVKDLRRRADAAFQALADGRAAAAEEQLRPLAEQFALAFGPGDGRTLRTCHDLALALIRLGRPEEAYCLLAELLPAAAEALGEEDPEVAAIQRRLARTRPPAQPCAPGLLTALLGAV